MSPGPNSVRREMVISRALDDWLLNQARKRGHGHPATAARELLEELMVDDIPDIEHDDTVEGAAR